MGIEKEPEKTSRREPEGQKSPTTRALILYELSVSLPGRHGKGS